LHEVVADQAESAILREHRRLVVERAVAELEDQPCRDAAGARKLNQVPVGENLALLRAQRQEPVDQPLGVTDGRKLARGGGPRGRGRGAENAENAESQLRRRRAGAEPQGVTPWAPPDCNADAAAGSRAGRSYAESASVDSPRSETAQVAWRFTISTKSVSR